MTIRRLVIFIILTLFLAVGAFLILSREETPLPKADIEEKESSRVSAVAENLEIPWALAFLPDKRIIFTERPGRVKIVDKEGGVKDIANITQVKHSVPPGLNSKISQLCYPANQTKHFPKLISY